jgi:hypothetical protein
MNAVEPERFCLEFIFMAGSRRMTRLTSKMRLAFLFSAVFLLAVARLGVAGEPPGPLLTLNPESFEDFVEFESRSRSRVPPKAAAGCSARPAPTVAAPIKHILSGLPVGQLLPAPDERANETVVLGGTGYNYQRQR